MTKEHGLNLNIDSPKCDCCYKCIRRKVGCHDSCEDYQKFLEQKRKFYKPKEETESAYYRDGWQFKRKKDYYK